MAVYCTERSEFVPYLTCLDCGDCKRSGTRCPKENKTEKEKMLDMLTDLVGKLSVSEEKHTKEELQSPKYAKAYNGLREKISEVSTNIMQAAIYEVRYEIGDLTETEQIPIQKIIKEIGHYRNIMLFEHKDVGLFELALSHSAKLVQSMLGDIWISRQREKEGAIS